MQTALKHPFITRNADSKIPINPADILINVHQENKIRRGIYFATFLSCIDNMLHKAVPSADYIKKIRQENLTAETQ